MPRWPIQAVGLAAIAVVLSASLRVIPMLAGALLVAASILLLSALVSAVLAFRSRDPYSLKELQRVHEQQIFNEVDEVRPDDDADVVCPNCGTVRGAVLPKCPHCKGG